MHVTIFGEQHLYKPNTARNGKK